MSNGCPGCGSANVSALVSSFWAPISVSGDMEFPASSLVESEAEIGSRRQCRDCGHAWDDGEETPFGETVVCVRCDSCAPEFGCFDGAERCIKKPNTPSRTTLADLVREVMSWHADKESSDYNECDKSKCHWCEMASDALGESSSGPTEPPQRGKRDSTAGNEDAKTVGPDQCKELIQPTLVEISTIGRLNEENEEMFAKLEALKPPPAVEAWMRGELDRYRYGCSSGAGGTALRFYSQVQVDKAAFGAIRDWLEKFLGEDPKAVPCFARSGK